MDFWGTGIPSNSLVRISRRLYIDLIGALGPFLHEVHILMITTDVPIYSLSFSRYSISAALSLTVLLTSANFSDSYYMHFSIVWRIDLPGTFESNEASITSNDFRHIWDILSDISSQAIPIEAFIICSSLDYIKLSYLWD